MGVRFRVFGSGVTVQVLGLHSGVHPVSRACVCERERARESEREGGKEGGGEGGGREGDETSPLTPDLALSYRRSHPNEYV